jgi:hypothetical protein
VVCSRFVGKRNFQGFIEVWVSDILYYWRTRLSSDFGETVLAGGVGFALRISEIDKVTKQKFCVSCVLMIHL